MALSPKIQEYYEFIHWFQNTYPDLYTNYWRNFDMPLDGEGVRVNLEHGITVDTHKMLLQKAWEFYNQKDKSKYQPISIVEHTGSLVALYQYKEIRDQ